MKHLRCESPDGESMVDCAENPVQSLTEMFVDMVQKGRIQRGQCPAMRPVFLKPHGVARGVFRMREDLPEDFRVGLFSGREYPLWMRFSSDTVPSMGDFETTIGVGIKLFDAPTPKIFGLPDDTTFDFIMQNMDVFFVDTARDMCEFTKAGVVDGDYGRYLDAHPNTKRILSAMAKPVGSVLASPYWAIVPFAFGEHDYVKYKLEPTLADHPPSEAPADPTYLGRDLRTRLLERGATFRFCIQRRTNPETMPLDQATVQWPEDESPFVHVADVVLPVQDIAGRGQADYGENLSWNIWRVTKEHAPQGSIAEARKVVYAASASQRHDVNGVPDGEPARPRPDAAVPDCVDSTIVRAAIHPAIGIARVGDAETEFFIGPEVTEPLPERPGFYRTSQETLKRQAARFRVYGYNAAGDVVAELTAEDADITWTVHVANRKADWFRFITAMDIPETKDLVLVRRNAKITGADRQALVIDPGPRSITGKSVAGPEHRFDTGTFKGRPVPLGELQTDEAGRLLFLGGHGVSLSPSGAPPFDPSEPDTFNNADDWFDDMSDGPVTATVSIAGRTIPVEGAWVVCAPPNYAPDVISWRTMHDLMVDTAISAGMLPVPTKTSFAKDVLPQLRRFSNLQWVNAGMAAMFGKGRPMDFEDSAFVGRLGMAPSPGGDPFKELRQHLFNAFRPYDSTMNDPRLWPWEYGDDFGGDLFQESPRTMLIPPAVQQLHLRRWVEGTFEADWDPSAPAPRSIDDVPLAEQPGMLDEAALHFCVADAFHPGCELTWPMRHATLYERPFRIRRREHPEPADSYGLTLDQRQALAPDGPLHAQGPGDLTRWMGLPWQGDTGYCRSGYDPDYDPYLPTFWPARVPNQVLTESDYEIVVDPTKSRAERLEAYNRRASWNRFMDEADSIPARMERLIGTFGQQGIVEARPGVEGDPDFPSIIYVENLPSAMQAKLESLARAASAPAATARETRVRAAGWGDEQHLADAVRLRARKKS